MTTSSTTTPSSLGNALAPPTAARRWALLQAGSGLAFLAFTALHLVNTGLAALGPAAYNGFQRALRPIYQYPAVELGLVLAPLLLHISAGVMRMRLRKAKTAPVSARARLHRYAGYFLLTFIFGHIGATRLPPLLRGIYPEFEGVSYTFQIAPYFFYWYYPALALAGLLHAAIGAPLALGVLGVRVPRALRAGASFYAPLALAVVFVGFGVANLAGLLHPLPDVSGHPFARLLRELLVWITAKPT